MALWQIALLALVAAWLLQSLGVWVQMRHYQGVFAELRSRWSDGHMGAGAAPAKLGKGAIALIVVDPAGAVRAVRVMQGRSVFAKFKPRDEFNGMSLAALEERVAQKGFDRGAGLAIAKAIEQIEKVGGDDLAAKNGVSSAVLGVA